MRNVYVVADNIFSPLGRNSRMNVEAVKEGLSGIRLHHSDISPDPFFASLMSPEEKATENSNSVFETIVYRSAKDALLMADWDPSGKKTGFILSTTKGNISLIENPGDGEVREERLSLNRSAEIIAGRLGIQTEPLVVSHACISGLLAMITGMRLIQAGKFDTLIVSGADLITSFIYSGFRSFQAISPNPCKPFDALRDGISLGEAAATVILSAEKKEGAIRLTGGSVSNDANHISGPSRTGEELWLAVRSAMKQAGIGREQIDFVSAHGTATRYNDEMEAKALHLAGLESVPVNSLKGYYGHTLGAAGILESVISMHSMKGNFILPTRGFSSRGTELPVNIVKEFMRKESQICLKTASGFGGCNAALIMLKA